jgi:radical SAM protein with 4Fe4S-binding SPASM domain
MTVVLGSNGTLIRRHLALALREAGLQGWGVSLDSTDAAAHDRVRGAPGAWQRTVDGLQLLRQLGQPFVVQPSIFSWNRHEIADLARLAQELGAETVNFYFLVCTGRGQGVTDISAADYEAALAEIAGLQREYAGRLMVNAKCAPHQKRVVHQQDSASPFVAGYEGGCPAATNYFRIGPSGEVSACPYIPPQGASLRLSGLAEIWETDAQLVRLRDRSALRGRCGACEYRDLCGGCRARALAAVGDLLAADPSCSYVPAGGQAARLAPELTFGGEVSTTMPWTPEARERLEAVPSFLAAMVARRVEQAAREAGADEVTSALMQQVRARAAGVPPGLRATTKG